MRESINPSSLFAFIARRRATAAERTLICDEEDMIDL
jgi:hypothetical protein